MDSTESPFYTSRTGASWFVSIIGGVKRRDQWTMPADMRIVTLVGGANLDLDEAQLSERPTLTKVSVVGGVSLQIPDDVDVEVEGFRIVGRVRVQPPVNRQGPARVVLKVREYSLWGGVHVKRL